MAGLKISSDLRALLGPTRDQGDRPTCAAFAATGAHEFDIPIDITMSPQWIAHHAARRTGCPNRGMTFLTLGKILKTEGQVDDCDCQYQPSPAIKGWMPDGTLQGKYYSQLNSFSYDFAIIQSHIDNNKPVILGLGLNRPFYEGGNGNPSRIDVGPPTHGLPLPGHAVIACGSAKSASESFLLIRNSWGTSWGDDGYCWMSETYLSSICFIAAILEEVQT